MNIITATTRSPYVGKVLIILSGADKLTLKKGKVVETGFFLVELATPLEHLLKNGFDVTFANPTGLEPHMDPLSNKKIWYMGKSNEHQKHLDLLDTMRREKNFSNPLKLSQITDQELNLYSGLFIPGGHAPLVDLSHNLDLGRVLWHFHNNNKPIASLCHGPIALLSANTSYNEWPFKDYKMTCYSNIEEKMNEVLWMDIVEPKVEDSLRSAGGVINDSILPMKSRVTVDRELITGQGPTSATDLANEFINALVNGPSVA